MDGRTETSRTGRHTPGPHRASDGNGYRYDYRYHYHYGRVPSAFPVIVSESL